MVYRCERGGSCVKSDEVRQIYRDRARARGNGRTGNGRRKTESWLASGLMRRERGERSLDEWLSSLNASVAISRCVATSAQGS